MRAKDPIEIDEQKNYIYYFPEANLDNLLNEKPY